MRHTGPLAHIEALLDDGGQIHARNRETDRRRCGALDGKQTLACSSAPTKPSSSPAAPRPGPCTRPSTRCARREINQPKVRRPLRTEVAGPVNGGSA